MSTHPTITPGLDNAALDPALVQAGELYLTKNMQNWVRAGRNEQFLFQSRNDINDMADSVYATCEEDENPFWVLQNDVSGFPDPSEFILVGFDDASRINALTYFEDWPASWSHPKPAPKVEPEFDQAAPSKGTRLASTGFMSFLKGGVVSAIVIAPFFGPWIALATASAFSIFCMWLAVKKTPGKPKKKTYEIVQSDTCYPKVKR